MPTPKNPNKRSSAELSDPEVSEQGENKKQKLNGSTVEICDAASAVANTSTAALNVITTVTDKNHWKRQGRQWSSPRKDVAFTIDEFKDFITGKVIRKIKLDDSAIRTNAETAIKHFTLEATELMAPKIETNLLELILQFKTAHLLEKDISMVFNGKMIRKISVLDCCCLSMSKNSIENIFKEKLIRTLPANVEWMHFAMSNPEALIVAEFLQKRFGQFNEWPYNKAIAHPFWYFLRETDVNCDKKELSKNEKGILNILFRTDVSGLKDTKHMVKSTIDGDFTPWTLPEEHISSDATKIEVPALFAAWMHWSKDITKRKPEENATSSPKSRFEDLIELMKINMNTNRKELTSAIRRMVITLETNSTINSTKELDQTYIRFLNMLFKKRLFHPIEHLIINTASLTGAEQTEITQKRNNATSNMLIDWITTEEEEKKDQPDSFTRLTTKTKVHLADETGLATVVPGFNNDREAISVPRLFALYLCCSKEQFSSLITKISTFLNPKHKQKWATILNEIITKLYNNEKTLRLLKDHPEFIKLLAESKLFHATIIARLARDNKTNPTKITRNLGLEESFLKLLESQSVYWKNKTFFGLKGLTPPSSESQQAKAYFWVMTTDPDITHKAVFLSYFEWLDQRPSILAHNIIEKYFLNNKADPKALKQLLRGMDEYGFEGINYDNSKPPTEQVTFSFKIKKRDGSIEKKTSTIKDLQSTLNEFEANIRVAPHIDITMDAFRKALQRRYIELTKDHNIDLENNVDFQYVVPGISIQISGFSSNSDKQSWQYTIKSETYPETRIDTYRCNTPIDILNHIKLIKKILNKIKEKLPGTFVSEALFQEVTPGLFFALRFVECTPKIFGILSNCFDNSLELIGIDEIKVQCVVKVRAFEKNGANTEKYKVWNSPLRFFIGQYYKNHGWIVKRKNEFNTTLSIRTLTPENPNRTKQNAADKIIMAQREHPDWFGRQILPSLGPVQFGYNVADGTLPTTQHPFRKNENTPYILYLLHGILCSLPTVITQAREINKAKKKLRSLLQEYAKSAEIDRFYTENTFVLTINLNGILVELSNLSAGFQLKKSKDDHSGQYTGKLNELFLQVACPAKRTTKDACPAKRTTKEMNIDEFKAFMDGLFKPITINFDSIVDSNIVELDEAVGLAVIEIPTYLPYIYTPSKNGDEDVITIIPDHTKKQKFYKDKDFTSTKTAL